MSKVFFPLGMRRSTKGSSILPHIVVKFRLIVFRPFIGEVIEGKVRSSSEEGIHVSLGFFDDILIPPTCVQPDTTFDPAEQVWTWSYQGTKMFLDTGELIRVRVLQEHFEERAPVPKETLMAAVRAASTMAASEPAPLVVEDTAAGQQTAPYRLTASIAEDGLGLVRWWQPTSAIDGSEEDEERELDGEK